MNYPKLLSFERLLLALLIVALVSLLAGCGGGIDTADEFMGPPVPITDVKPCPANVTACHPGPTGG